MEIEQAIQAIEEQQKQVKERSAAWMVGEQLKDICRRERSSAEILLQDLAVKEMSIAEAEKKIKAFADKHKTGNFACVTPAEAENILREFYGLGAADALSVPSGQLSQRESQAGREDSLLNLLDFL